MAIRTRPRIDGARFSAPHVGQQRVALDDLVGTLGQHDQQQELQRRALHGGTSDVQRMRLQIDEHIPECQARRLDSRCRPPPQGCSKAGQQQFLRCRGTHDVVGPGVEHGHLECLGGMAVILGDDDDSGGERLADVVAHAHHVERAHRMGDDHEVGSDREQLIHHGPPDSNRADLEARCVELLTELRRAAGSCVDHRHSGSLRVQTEPGRGKGNRRIGHTTSHRSRRHG